MILMSELYRSLSGALRLACFKQDGILFFENTVTAFWRSFWAAAIAFPPYAFLLFIRVEPSIINVGPSTAILIHCIAYVAGWFAFPLVMFYLCNLINRQTHFCRYCAAHNWAALLQIVAIGQEDEELTQEPEITFFKQVYKRHVPFAIQTVPLMFSNQFFCFGFLG